MLNYSDISNYTDYSEEMDIEIENLSRESSVAVLIILALLFIFGIILNAISIIAILNAKKLETISILILNLAFADCVYLLGIPFFAMSALFGSWPFGFHGCRIFYLIDYVGMIVSVYTVAALSLERYLIVADSKRNFDKISDKFKLFIVYFYLAIIWFIGIIFSLPLILNIHLGKSAEDNYTCELNIDETKKNILFIAKFIFIFLMPFTIILFSSVKLILFLKNKKKNSVSLKFSKRKSLQGEKILIVKTNGRNHHKKAIKIVLSIVFMFIIQWLPLWTGNIKILIFL